MRKKETPPKLQYYNARLPFEGPTNKQNYKNTLIQASGCFHRSYEEYVKAACLDFNHKNEFSLTFSRRIDEEVIVFWNTRLFCSFQVTQIVANQITVKNS